MGAMKQVSIESEELLRIVCERFPDVSAPESLECLNFMAHTGAMTASTKPPSWKHKYTSYEELVFTEGHLGTWKPRPDSIAKMPYKQCFMNALELAQAEGLRYVEGYASTILVVNHAWCEDDDGTVVDPTWDEMPERPFYMGIRMDPAKVAAWTVESGYWGVLASDWVRLSKGLPSVLDGTEHLR